jgi:hypothetical protein
MADVEMTDAAPKATKKAVAAGGEADGKKRFEVKKVGYNSASVSELNTDEADSGTRLRCGLGTLSWTTAPSAEITSWTCASTVKQTRLQQRARSAQSHGVSAM